MTAATRFSSTYVRVRRAGRHSTCACDSSATEFFFSSREREPSLHHPRNEWGEPRAGVKSGGPANRVSLRRVRMNHIAERAQTHASFDRGREFRNDLARVTRNHRRTNNLIGPLFHDHLHEAVSLSVQYGAIDLFQFLRISRDCESALLRLDFIEPDVRDLGIGVGAPWNSQLARALASEE